MPTVLLVRHGQASFGAADYDLLSDAGKRQSRILAAALERRGFAIDRLVTGTLRRQRETAAALAGPEPRVDPRWDEFETDDVLEHHSDTTVRLDGDDTPAARSNREFQALLELALAAWIGAGDTSPTRQSWASFGAAGLGAMEALAKELGRGETGLVVSSGGTIASLVAAILGAPHAFVPLNRVLVNTGVTKLAIGSSGINVVGFNDHSHLEEVDRDLITYR